MKGLIRLAALLLALVAALILFGFINVDLQLNASLNKTAINKTLQGINGSTLMPAELKACVYGSGNKEVEKISSSANASVRLKTLYVSEDFSECAITILLDDGNGAYMERATRSAVKKRVQEGMGLIVEKKAASLFENDAAATGWGIELQEIMPVSIEAPGHEAAFLGEENLSGTFTDRKTVPGLRDFGFSGWNVTKTFKTEDAVEVSTLAEGGPTGRAYTGIALAPKAGLKGSVFYFSYSIANDAETLESVLKYMAGEQVALQKTAKELVNQAKGALNA